MLTVFYRRFHLSIYITGEFFLKKSMFLIINWSRGFAPSRATLQQECNHSSWARWSAKSKTLGNMLLHAMVHIAASVLLCPLLCPCYDPSEQTLGPCLNLPTVYADNKWIREKNK